MTTSTTSFTDAWLPGPDGTAFYTRTYTASSPRAALLFVHGFAEHVARHEWAHGVYVLRGVSVFAFDQRGFGRTGMDVAHRSNRSTYCRTSWREQFADIEWWLKHVRETWPGLPVLFCTMQGGGLTLGFPTRSAAPPSPESVSLLAGVIATSPLLVQPSPVPHLVRFAAGIIGKVLPVLLVPAPVNADALTHDPAFNEATPKDPMCPQTVGLKVLSEVLGGCEQILLNDYKRWPTKLPLLIVHGTSDKVTSCPASREFFEKVDAEDKELKLYEGGYHELGHEPDGVKEKFVEECIAWILKRVECSERDVSSTI